MKLLSQMFLNFRDTSFEIRCLNLSVHCPMIELNLSNIILNVFDALDLEPRLFIQAN